jgi:hypothetical protein
LHTARACGTAVAFLSVPAARLRHITDGVFNNLSLLADNRIAPPDLTGAWRHKMKRRDFFRQAGIGSTALVSLPDLAHALTKHAGGQDDDHVERAGFHFVCVSQAGTVDGVSHRINMSGCGAFNFSEVEGGGSYDHFDNASPVPKTLLSAGTWDARRVLSFIPIGTYGVLASGILEMEVKLRQQIPSHAVIPATLRIACGIGAAGFDAGELEGITLRIPGAPFGPFAPFVVCDGATMGITIFTTSTSERD